MKAIIIKSKNQAETEQLIRDLDQKGFTLMVISDDADEREAYSMCGIATNGTLFMDPEKLHTWVNED